MPQAAMHESRYEVLLSAAEGETGQETARRTGCSTSWIAHLRHEVCDELGAKNMTHAVALAYQRGILSTRACDLCALRAH